MRLTARDDPETIKRYAHIRPARGWGVRACAAECGGTSHTCTLARGHRGPHVAHGRLRRVVAVWSAGKEKVESRTNPKRVADTMKRRPPGGRVDHGFLGAIWGYLSDRNWSVEDVSLLILFLGMLGFAVHWLSLILG